MAQFKTLSFCHKVFLWHQASSYKCPMCLHCVYKVSKYQDVSVKAVEQVEFPVYALPMQH